MVEMAVLVLAPLAGWLANKQLEYNRETRDNGEAIKTMLKTLDYTRERVDAIYDHLIARR